MSKENVKNFYEALRTDESLQEKVTILAESKESKSDTLNALILIAGEAGYTFNDTDIDDYIDELKKSTSLFGVRREWNDCWCVFGGGGIYTNEMNPLKTHTCACVIGGGGAKDPSGLYLMCVLSGNLIT